MGVTHGRHGDQRNMAYDIRTIREESDKIAEFLMKSLRLNELNQAIRQLKDMNYPSIGIMFYLDFYMLCSGSEEPTRLSPPTLRYIRQAEKKSSCKSTIFTRRLKAEQDGEKEKWIHDIGNLTFLLGKDNEQLKDPDISYLQRYKKFFHLTL